MSKVDWISWKTDPKDIINPNSINEMIDDKVTDFNNNLINIVYDSIKTETEKGGLDKDSLGIDGKAPANEQAIGILKKIEGIEESIEKLKTNIENQSKEQKHIEKEQLIMAIEEKINEQQKVLENMTSLRDKVRSSNDVVDIEQVNDIIEVTNKRIKNLQERLEVAKNI